MMTWPFATRQDLNLKKMVSRMLKASRLNGDTFRELRDDPSATVQSVSLVAIIGLSYGVGLGLAGFFIAGTSLLDTFTIILIAMSSAIIIALVWLGMAFLIITKVFRGRIGYSALARPFFFSWSPGLLFIFMSVPTPAVSNITRAVGTAWIVVANVFAVKNSVGISTPQSMLTFMISAISMIFLSGLLLTLIQLLAA
jgi:hypothetical protein